MPHSPLPNNGSYTVEEAEAGYVIKVVKGQEVNFNLLARQLLNSDDIEFSVFPQRDDHGGYHTVQIIPHEGD